MIRIASAAVLVLVLLASASRAQSAWTTTQVWGTGDSANRIDVVIMGDGYTAAQIPVFHQHVANFVNAWLNETPMSRYKHFVNIWRVDVESPQSGADKPAPCFTTPVFVNTALNATYCTGGVQRCLTASTSLSLGTAAINVPAYDEVIVVVNDTVYGGCAGTVSAYAGGNSASLDVAIHELGHSIFGLADEYDYGASTNTYTGGEFSQVNLSIHDATSMASLQTKWHYWIGTEGISAFEGAGYYEFGVYRPKSNCLMRNLGIAFCAVCREEAVEDFYDFVNDEDAAIPPAGSGPHTYDTVLRVEYPATATGPVFVAQWKVDGVPVVGGTVSAPSAGTFAFEFDPSTVIAPGSGTHTVSVKVSDPTTWWQKTPTLEPFPEVSWTVSDIVADLTFASFSVDAPPAGVGRIVNVTETVSNLGQTPSVPVRVGYYLSTDDTITTADALMDVRLLPALAPGGSETLTHAVRVPPTVAAAGGFRIGAIVDDLGEMDETNDGNNAILAPSGPWAITNAPSLTCTTSFMQAAVDASAALSIDAGPEFAGQDYLLVPSITLTTYPGDWLGALTGFLPITLDDLSWQVLGGQIGFPVFQDFGGSLDASGSADAVFFKPALPPGTSGFIQFGYALVDENPVGSGNLSVPLVGNAVSILLF